MKSAREAWVPGHAYRDQQRYPPSRRHRCTYDTGDEVKPLSACRDCTSLLPSVPPSCRIRPSASRLMTRSPKLIEDIARPWLMTNNSLFHDFLEVPLLRQSRYQLLSIRSVTSKAFSNAPRSGTRRCTVLSSNCHQSRTFVHEEAEQMVTSGRAALAGLQKTGLDLWQVPRQDSVRHTYGLRIWSGPESNRIAFPRR